MTVSSSTLQDVGEAFAAEGYAHVPSLGVSEADLVEARTILDRMFDDFASIPKQFAHDLGAGPDPDHPILPEINAVSTLAPALRRSPVYRAALEVATSLLGPGTHLIYDHAIYKSPGAAGRTSWHQDSGYDDVATNRVAIWVPFQDTSEVDGCMRYVARSHLGGRRTHLERRTAEGKVVKYLEVADDESVAVPCSLGGATLHDLHTIHGAGPNLGQNVRKAWIMDFTRSSAAGRLTWAAKDKLLARKYALR